MQKNEGLNTNESGFRTKAPLDIVAREAVSVLLNEVPSFIRDELYAQNQVGLGRWCLEVGTCITIKGSFRRAEKSRKVLMMMKAAKLGWAGAGAGKRQGRSRSRAEAGTGQELGRSR